MYINYAFKNVKYIHSIIIIIAMRSVAQNSRIPYMA